MRSARLVPLLLTLLAVLPVPAATAARHGATRPNVVVVMTDDQDFRSMWAMPKTRALVGRTGTTFDTNVVSYPLCCPSRATFLTGQYSHNHGVVWNNWPQGGYYRFKGAETLPVWLRRAGYRTIHIGKYLNEYGERDPREVPKGWSEWWGGVDPTTYSYYGFTLNHNGRPRTFSKKPSNYSTDVYARIAKHEIRSAARAQRPFFLNIAVNAPHTVAVATNATKEGLPAVPAPRDRNAFAHRRLPRYPNFDEVDLSDKPGIELFYPTLLSPDDIASLTEHYRGRMASLLAVDDLVAGVHRTLVKAGVARNTVVIFTSDNGWILGEHRLRDNMTQTGRASGVKYVPFEGSSRVPLMISGPGFPAGRVVKGVTANVDLAPTIEQLAGAKPRLPQDGMSLLRAARRPSVLDGRAVLLESGENARNLPVYASIRTRRYRRDFVAAGFEALFDLKRDPWELQSVHDDSRYTAVKDALDRGLAQLRTCRGASCHVKVKGLPAPTGPPLQPH
jgi:arylsulfatase A-like enzyme